MNELFFVTFVEPANYDRVLEGSLWKPSDLYLRKW